VAPGESTAGGERGHVLPRLGKYIYSAKRKEAERRGEMTTGLGGGTKEYEEKRTDAYLFLLRQVNGNNGGEKESLQNSPRPSGFGEREEPHID